jgi:olfactory receptor
MMVYGCYVAVCDPLSYSAIMCAGLCRRLAITSCVSGYINSHTDSYYLSASHVHKQV